MTEHKKAAGASRKVKGLLINTIRDGFEKFNFGWVWQKKMRCTFE